MLISFLFSGTRNSTLFCQILSQDGQYFITRTRATKIWSKSWNQNDTHTYYNPFLISCYIPFGVTPISVSFSLKPCEKAPIDFKISPEDTLPSKDLPHIFTICVKPLNFNKDISLKLLQWIVINQILGATKMNLYVENLPKKTLKILQSFQKSQNGITLLKHDNLDSSFYLDETTNIWQKRRNEIITYNDCLYRNIHTSHFIIPVDIDEIIVPRHVTTWAELLHESLSESKDNFASYTVRNAYYLRQFNVKKRLKEKIVFFRNVVRSDFSGERESGKSFVSTKNALTVFNHYALKTLRPGIGRIKFLKKELVQMNHYKDNCDTVILPECAKYLSSPVRVVDNVILKYKKVFYREYAKALMFLNQTMSLS
ncbi:hypothetical protein Zmor_024167 [Zophobas morio]|uniref:Glycosyltransferase family 92 protein n=1 Tax=Zophobas morio TaxID=2755281 RepID=A0AA38HYE2_9CUCU|nr:hypothetical protein Zmor_024167 [Zophobas morio]